jgi:hypothetical protein
MPSEMELFCARKCEKSTKLPSYILDIISYIIMVLRKIAGCREKFNGDWGLLCNLEYHGLQKPLRSLVTK